MNKENIFCPYCKLKAEYKHPKYLCNNHKDCDVEIDFRRISNYGGYEATTLIDVKMHPKNSIYNIIVCGYNLDNSSLEGSLYILYKNKVMVYCSPTIDNSLTPENVREKLKLYLTFQ